MRIGVISDIHGNLVALEAVLRDMKRHSPDVVLNLGDCVTSPLWPRETFELLESLNMPTVRGNHDRVLANMPESETMQSVHFTHDALTDSQRASLGRLPPFIHLDDTNILAVHGTPASDTQYLLHDDVDGRLSHASDAALIERIGYTHASLVLCGHSHTQYAAMTSTGVTALNPGSVGCPRYADNKDRSRAEAGSPHARYAVVTRGRINARWTADLIALDYDWDPVVDQARRNGRPDWAEGFLHESA